MSQDRNPKEDFEKLYYASMSMEQQAEQYQRELDVLGQSVADLTNSKNALEALGKEDSEKALIPLGGGVNLEVDIESNPRLLVHIGAGVLIRKSVEDASGQLEKHLASMNERANAVGEAMNKTLHELERIRPLLQEMNKQFQEGEL